MVDNPTPCFQPLSSPRHSWMHWPTWDHSVTEFCFDFLVCFLEPSFLSAFCA